MTTTGPICTLALLTHCAFGGLLGGLFDCLKDHHRGHEYNGPECCRACLVEQRTVINLIAIMQKHPNWRERDDAAHELREYDWRAHPEIAPSLAFTMLEDPHEEVREEAAETLAKLAPCDPSAHVALREAAVADPDHATRKWARRALAKLDHRCLDDCPICGPAPEAVVEAPVPTIVEEEVIMPPDAYGRPLPPIDPRPRVDGELPIEPYPGGIPPMEALPPIEGYGPEVAPYPGLPDPNARPGLLPEPLPPAEGPIEVLPPAEVPPVAPPAASPFGRPPGVSRREDGRSSSRSVDDLPVLRLTVGRPNFVPGRP